MFKFLENLFKDDIKESIIDIPRRIYAPGVFDDADTDNPKLKPVVLDMIKDQLKDFERLGFIKVEILDRQGLENYLKD